MLISYSVFLWIKFLQEIGGKVLDKILITNNPLVKEKFSNTYQVKFYDIGYIQILEIVRDKIHLGYKLLSHPLSGSVKPNQSPFETVIITKNRTPLDRDSLMIIENSIQTARKFAQDEGVCHWNKSALEDFQRVDFSLIENALKIHRYN